MKIYTTLMSAYGVSAGIDYKFGGKVANTLEAHRVIQHFQEDKGVVVADRIINCNVETKVKERQRLQEKLTKGVCVALYSQYFEKERHPSSDETLLQATKDAEIPQAEAKEFIDDKEEGMMDVKMLVREQAGNGIDSVPYIIFEGMRRDMTLVGAKEVEEYVKTLETIARESR